MAVRREDKKEVRIHNKSSKPDNIVRREHEIMERSRELEAELPSFMKSFFSYLRTGVLPNTRLAYLFDIRFFCEYLVKETALTKAAKPADITAEEFGKIKARDVNAYINDYCRHYRVYAVFYPF